MYIILQINKWTGRKSIFPVPFENESEAEKFLIGFFNAKKTDVNWYTAKNWNYQIKPVVI